MNYLVGDPSNFHCVIDEIGAMVHKCGDADARMIYPFFERVDGKKRGGIPMCFPFFGPSHRNFADVPQHGWLREQKLHMISDTVITQGLFFVGDSNEEDVRHYVYPRISYSVLHILRQQTRAIETHLSFFGMGPGKIPLNPAFHPYFPNDGMCMVKIGNRTFTHFAPKAQCVSIAGGDDIVIITGKLTILMRLRGFGRHVCVYLWSDAPDQYFCVEPVFNPVELFHTEEGFYLHDSSSWEMSMMLTCI